MLVVFALVPIYLYCGYMDEASYLLFGHPAKYLVGNSFIVGLLALFAFVFGAASMEGQRRERPEAWVVVQRARNALTVLYFLVLIAYGVFFFPLLLRPQIILEHLHGSVATGAELRQVLNHLPGFTSLVALQSLCVALSLSYDRLTGERLPRVYRILMITVVISCVLRAWLWSERLALVELMVPAAVAKYAAVKNSRNGLSSRLLSLAPLVGLTVMFVLFAAGEYFRSWQYYKAYLPYSFLEFSWTQFLGYYATALGNGALFYTLNEPNYTPLMTALWFYKFPLWSWLSLAVDSAAYNPSEVLGVYLNPEFNNLSGVFMPIVDFGVVLGIACWLVLGMLSGALYRSFATGQIFGLMLYPAWFVGISEILRIFYWGESRFTPVVIFAVLLILYLGKDMQQHRRRIFHAVLTCGFCAYLIMGNPQIGSAASRSTATTDCEPLFDRSARSVVNVRDFGARGDGKSDDGQAIQAAIELTLEWRPGSHSGWDLRALRRYSTQAQ